MQAPPPNPAFGNWTYRSLQNNPDLQTDFYALEFGHANLKIDIDDQGKISGKIFDTGWELQLKGTYQAGNRGILAFQGSGNVGGAPWAYDYQAYPVPHNANGIKQAPALVGSVTRAIAHPDGQGGGSARQA